MSKQRYGRPSTGQKGNSKEKGMDKRKEKFIETLKIMHAKIGQDFVNEKDPLTRCELAKGFMQIGDYLSKY
ncbi:hypothetical protein HO996_05665 [Streptococcus suis]|nr:hypothetical protein [Streptococcus suis]